MRIHTFKLLFASRGIIFAKQMVNNKRAMTFFGGEYQRQEIRSTNVFIGFVWRRAFGQEGPLDGE